MSTAASASAPVGAPQHAVELRQIMSLADKVGQITQLDILQIVDYDEAEKGNFKLDHEKLQKVRAHTHCAQTLARRMLCQRISCTR